MKLNLENISSLPSKIEGPQFDVEKMIDDTCKNPVWIHFGAGNIFRSFMAILQQELLNTGNADKGIIVAETYDYEIIDAVYKPYDNLSLLALMEATGNLKCSLVASVAEAVKGDSFDRLKEIFCNPSLQIVSFTITEKGYALKDYQGNYFKNVENDMKSGSMTHTMSMITALMYERYKSGAAPIALLSLDNCSHNGEKLQSSVVDIAQHWCKNGIAEQSFVDYLTDKSCVAYPWSMIDKITPRPDSTVQKAFEDMGFEDMDPVITEKSTYIAPFVNAEVPQYLVIEDDFPNGRPPLEKAGVYFTDRDTVNRAETMKVTTCLNPHHTALAVFGCLLGYTKISDEMNDPLLSALVYKIGYEEGMKVVTHPEIINPVEFLDEVLKQRLPNPYIPDTPQRIATDTSQKIPIRFGKTIEAYYERFSSADELECIPLVLAGWLRYLLGVDDNGNKMERSPDPMLEKMDKSLGGITLGNAHMHIEKLKPVLSNKELFGVDLYECGIGEKTEKLFIRLSQDKGAVRRTLEELLIV